MDIADLHQELLNDILQLKFELVSKADKLIDMLKSNGRIFEMDASSIEVLNVENEREILHQSHIELGIRWESEDYLIPPPQPTRPMHQSVSSLGNSQRNPHLTNTSSNAQTPSFFRSASALTAVPNQTQTQSARTIITATTTIAATTTHEKISPSLTRPSGFPDRFRHAQKKQEYAATGLSKSFISVNNKEDSDDSEDAAVAEKQFETVAILEVESNNCSSVTSSISGFALPKYVMAADQPQRRGATGATAVVVNPESGNKILRNTIDAKRSVVLISEEGEDDKNQKAPQVSRNNSKFEEIARKHFLSLLVPSFDNR
ncbi:hypothetical protein HK100_010335, partial [Physocladia obscura]